MNQQLSVLNSSQPSGGAMVEIASTRQAQEVQAAMVIAKRFPRDMISAQTKITESCKRKTLAERAMYSYPRGTQTVTGPSIRLAEAMAQAWGNLDFGIVELDKKPSLGNTPGESTMMAYCYDLETNTRSTKIFTVKHRRDTKKGSYNLTDERDIYEIAANQGARRLRACILNVIPGDVTEAAIEQCEVTLKTDKEPIVDRIKKMVSLFGEYGVNQQMLEKRLGHKLEVTTETELVDLRKVYTSIKDGFADRTEFFDLPTSETPEAGEPQEAQPAAKSVKSVKNVAPQTKEEAQNWKPETKKVDAKQPDPQEVRKTLTSQILAQAKVLGLDSDSMVSSFLTIVGKDPAQCTNADLEKVLAAFSQVEGQ